MNDEFILTNRFGGYISYDLINGNTRKYHGILVPGIKNYMRKVIVASANEYIFINNKKYNFSNNAYLTNKKPGITNYISKAFYLPQPIQKMKIKDVTITKKVINFEEKNKVILEYIFQTNQDIYFHFEPLLNNRKIDDIGLKLSKDLYLEDWTYKQNIKIEDDMFLEIKTDMNFQKNIILSKNHYYKLEELRGYEALEDLIIPGIYSQKINCGQTKIQISFDIKEKFKIRKIINFSKKILNPIDNKSIASDVSRFKQVHGSIDDSFLEFLIYNARKFIVHNDERYSILAGYHWFGEWSRDTFISFKGILLGLGRFYEARKILLTWSKYISKGLLPNQLDSKDYNSLDGVLWYFIAIWHYWQSTSDRETIKVLLPKMERIIYALNKGTHYGIKVDSQGFLIWTDEKKALTWMDSCIDGNPVINRSGAAIDIQALWYNALQITEKLALLNNYNLLNITLFDQLEEKLEKNINIFWNESKKIFADRINNNQEKIFELRPNQLTLFALPFRLGSYEQGIGMIKVIEQELLVVQGLRTLSPNDKKYNNNYKGDQAQRDKLYHQGVVWPWLILYYYLAKMKLNKKSSQSLKDIKQHMKLAWKNIIDQKLINLPELFSEDEMKAAGTISQAWSVAAYLETIMSMSEFY